MIYNIFIYSLLFSLHCFALPNVSEIDYYQSEYWKNTNIQKEKENIKIDAFFTNETTVLFSKIYGKNALVRLVFIEETILDLKGASLYKKLSTIDKLVNRIHFMPDNKQWNKKNYWSTPLETIGTNYGDTEDMALLKYVLMLKVGISPRDIQLIKKEIPFKHKYKKYKENISLFYFTKKYIPLVLDYHFRGGEIYKYKDEFKFTYITKAPNKIWDFIFQKDIKIADVDKILNYLEESKRVVSK